MPFCPSCGSQTSGSFCTACGRPIGSAAASGGVPAAQVPPAAAKKSNVLVWVLVGVAGLFLLVGVAVVGGGLFLAHKVQQAGLDPDLFRSNPALAMGKLVTALNPDLDVLRVDENRGVIEVKDKRTGKTMMLNFEDAKKGKIVFEEEGKGPVTIETNQGDGGVHVRTSDGTMDIGTSAKAPAWIPVYPGAQTQGAMTSTSSGGEGGTVSFLTKDSMEKVGQHYEDMLKATGYQIESQTKTPDALLFSAKNGDKVLSVIIGKGSEGTSIGITYSKK